MYYRLVLISFVFFIAPINFLFNFIWFLFFVCFLFSSQDRDKLPRQHLGDTVEELKRYNARRKLKGAVQSVTNGHMSFDADTNSSILIPN